MLRVNSPTVGDELRTVIFTDAKAIFTAVKGEQRRKVYSKRGNAVCSCLRPDWSVGIKEWKSSVDYLVRIVSGNSKSILFPRKLNHGSIVQRFNGSSGSSGSSGSMVQVVQ